MLASFPAWSLNHITDDSYITFDSSKPHPALASQLGKLIVKPLEIAFPPGIVGRQADQPCHDLPALPQRVDRLLLVTLVSEHGRQFPVRNQEISLPSGIPGIGCRQPLRDSEARLVGL